MLIALLALVSFYPFLVLAAFTRPAEWGSTEIWQDESGTWCFYPGPDPTVGSVCPEVFNRLPELRTALAVHLEQVEGVAIAYYSSNGTMLGGATWPMPISMSNVSTLNIVTCASGQALNLRYFTLCRFALHDNDLDDPAAEQCVLVADSAPTVIDGGCYPLLPPLPPSVNASDGTMPLDPSYPPEPSPQSTDTPPAGVNILNTVGEVAGAIVALLALGLAIVKGPEYVRCAHEHIASIYFVHERRVNVIDPIPLQAIHLRIDGVVTAASSAAVTVYHDARSASEVSI